MSEEVADFVPWYWKSLDFDALTREFPPPPDYFIQNHETAPRRAA